MSDSPKAVFLSYASQDAEAARRIAEALRAAGVEVWFDQSELVGGDAWDHKIRRQIKDCALLIPIISAATQARTEGYFRLEWRLADQRTHLMAKGRPFLLPVVVDDTRDAGAHVPESFLEVQWTRLPGGETTPAFAQRVAKLLSGEMEAGRPRPAERGEGAASPRKSRPTWLRFAWAGVGLLFAVTYAVRPIWQASRHAEAKPVPSATTAATATGSAARKLADQARALIDDDPLAVRENYLTAKRLGERAIELDPGEAEAYAVSSRALCVLIADYRDSSPASIALARSRAESATRLAPDSVEAALALATVDLLTRSRPAELEQRLVSLLQKVPDDRRVLWLLQRLATSQSRADEVEKWVDRAVALPGGDPESLNNRVNLYWALNKYPQMAATLEQSLAQRVTAGACHYKLMLLVWGWGDLPAGRAWVEQMPASLLQEDRVAMLAYLTWYWSRQPDRALEVLQRFPRPFIEQGALFVSTDFLAGNAQLLAGHAEVAKVAYAAGLKAVNERLAAEPNNPRILFEKTRLLVRLGQRAEADQTLRILRELAGPDAALMQVAEILVLTGSNDEAIAAAGRSIDRKRSRWPVAVNHLRNDPAFDPLRADPRFQAIIATGEAQLAELRAGGGPAAGPVPAADIAPLSEARQLAAKARELFLGLDATKDDFALAEDMLKQALAKAPGDAEVWATYAQLHQRYGARGWDNSNERREAAWSTTQRALRLDPHSYEARFAAAGFFTGTEKENQEHERALRDLLRERPDDQRVLRALGSLLRAQPGHLEEAIQFYDRAAQLPGGDPLALYNKALALWFVGRSREAQVALAASLAQQPFIGSRLMEAYFAVSVAGDLDRAQSLVAQLPSAVFLEDRGCFFAYQVYRYRDEPERALAVVQSLSRDWLNDNWFRGPRGLLAGNALAQAGRPEAAAVEWRTALKVVDQRLAANPSDLHALGNRVILLAELGEVAAARQLLPTVRQMLQVDKPGVLPPVWFAQACLLAGDKGEAMRVIDTALQSKLHASIFTASDLRHDPTWTPLRGDPEFTRLIAYAERVERGDKL